MAINEWWAGDASQRFWMEITDRADLGADLFAPTLDGSGRSYWGYELITYVRPGDIVFHWHKSLVGEPAIVGWSRATGAYEDTEIEWQAQGTVGRARGNLKSRPAWRMPLWGYTALGSPVLISEVRAQEESLRQVFAELEANHPGTLYFPFGFSNRRELRAQQTYFVKVPRELLDVVGLPEDELPDAPTHDCRRKTGKTAKSKGSGYLADPVVRSAIEWHAVNNATAYYEANGFVVAYTGASKPYDLVVAKRNDTRRVEVKGSSQVAEKVELTYGEVDNSRSSVTTDLHVVDSISWAREPNGDVSTWGGEVRRWENWTAAEDRLKAIRFRYELPGG